MYLGSLQRPNPQQGGLIDGTHEAVPEEHVASIFFGLYERPEIGFLRRFLDHGMGVVEISSGIGVVTAHILTRLGRRDKPVCMEANPNLLSALRKNIELNAPEAKVRVLNRALDYSGKETLGLAIDSRNLGSHVQHQPCGDEVQVRTMSLHDLLRESELGDFGLVCDADGAEAGMILCDSEGLSRRRRMIIELHPTVHEGSQYNVADLRRELELSHGFSLVAAQHGVHVYEKLDYVTAEMGVLRKARAPLAEANTA